MGLKIAILQFFEATNQVDCFCALISAKLPEYGKSAFGLIFNISYVANLWANSGKKGKKMHFDKTFAVYLNQFPAKRQLCSCDKYSKCFNFSKTFFAGRLQNS